MSLPARQERILGRMAHSLRASEPRLTSMFAIFGRLARDEDMPRLEALDAWSLPFWGWRQRLTRLRRERRAASGARAAYAPGARLRAILLVPVMLAALAPAVFLGFGGRSVSRCRTGAPAAAPRTCAEPARGFPVGAATTRVPTTARWLTPAPAGSSPARGCRGPGPWAATPHSAPAAMVRPVATATLTMRELR